MECIDIISKVWMITNLQVVLFCLYESYVSSIKQIFYNEEVIFCIFKGISYNLWNLTIIIYKYNNDLS